MEQSMSSKAFKITLKNAYEKAMQAVEKIEGKRAGKMSGIEKVEIKKIIDSFNNQFNNILKENEERTEMTPFDYNTYLKNNPLLKEALSDRASSKKPMDIKSLANAVQKETAGEYDVRIDNNMIFVEPKEIISGVIGRLTAGILEIQGDSIIVGATNNTIDDFEYGDTAKNKVNVSRTKKFSMSDINGAFDYLADIMEIVDRSYSGNEDFKDYGSY